MSEVVGRVIEIMRYPVKSMAGERRSATEIDWQGLEGDRQYGFVRKGNATRFPWFTARDHSELVRYRPHYDDPDRPRTSPVQVTTPDGHSLSLQDAALRAELERAAGIELQLLQLGIGAYDAMPVSIVTTASLAALEGRHGSAIDRHRFRANIVIESDMRDEDWQGGRVRFGDGDDAAELLVACPVGRCAMVTIDPATADRDPTILRTVAQEFGNAFTMYASTARPGVVREGDRVQLEREDGFRG
ncbi:molybdenum cofactor biosysynthesis protein [Sphingomonas sp. DBB INV C78]|uniref:MOSC domain-containing protein n=1 Tax=Sphingomonas sp. DBB INV C78 TaxID=3349434 RepID=UPI0036D3F675